MTHGGQSGARNEEHLAARGQTVFVPDEALTHFRELATRAQFEDQWNEL